VLLLSASLGAQAAAATQELMILHDNDIHGHLRPFCYVEAAEAVQEHCDVGGAAKRSTLIRALRAKAGVPVFVMDAGDTTTRGPLATMYEGIDEIEAMNAIGYDMAAVGNNEFKLKDGADAHDASGAQAAFERLVRRSRFPWLCANVTDANGALLPGVQPFIVRKAGQLKVAFLGLTAQRSSGYPQTQGLLISDPIAAARVWIPRARAEADVVVAVTHLGVIDDRRLVSETRGIDAVVGGDSHTFLYEPLQVRNLDGAVVPIVQDGKFGVRVGEFRLIFEGDSTTGWRLGHFAGRLVAVDASARADPAVVKLVEGYAHPLDVCVGAARTIGSTPSDRIRVTAETLASAWKAAAGTEVGLQREEDAYDTFRDHQVSRYAVLAVLPFHETLWRGELRGMRLKQLLDTPTSGGGAMRATIPEADIIPAKFYSVATTTFLAQTELSGGEDTGQDSRRAAEEWLAAAASRD
jgi:5'-nucleotidase/UDP-sugar diphosphatase